jgi:hypothetical protein
MCIRARSRPAVALRQDEFAELRRARGTALKRLDEFSQVGAASPRAGERGQQVERERQ